MEAQLNPIEPVRRMLDDKICPACSFYERGTHSAICRGGDDIVFFLGPLSSSAHTIPARRTICHERELTEEVPIICQGWAAAAITVADGRRQILSFLLPGDIVSMALLLEPSAHCVVEAITEVRYRTFKRSELKQALFSNPDMIDNLLKSWIKRKLRVDQLVVDLGRRTAEERISRLILGLMDRLMQLGLTQGPTMDFPLRQRHIADATGLTPVHVSKVLTDLRRRGLIEISDRSLTILDLAELTRLATFK